VLLLVLAVPILLALGSAWSEDARVAAAHERATSHRVAATVVALTRLPSADDSAMGASNVTLQWTESDGAVRTASRTVYSSVDVGDPRPLWVDTAGRPVPPPTSDSDAVVEGVLEAFAALFVWGLALAGGVVALRWDLDRRRLRQWDEDWLDFRRRGDRGAAG
jgi:hypothetical protein